jgi:uncharacterized membrane protein YheB (UPF0754 family)
MILLVLKRNNFWRSKMEDNPGFRFLKQAFDKFAAKYSADEISGRVVRSVAAGGKAVVEQGMQEFPKTFVKQMTSDLYALLASQDTADGISTMVRSFDEEKVKEMVDTFAASLKDRETALKLAKQIKEALKQASATDIEAQIDGMLSMGNVPLEMRMLFMAFFGQLKPAIDSMKHDNEEEIADKISELADNIPSDMIAAQVAAMTREVTPESVSKQAHDIVGRMPSPQAVADILHGVGGAASQHLDRLSKVLSPSEIPGILSDFAQNAADIVSDTIAQDNTAKKTFNKNKGQDFDL